MTISVRRARPEDADAILRLFAAVAAERRHILSEPPIPWNEAAIALYRKFGFVEEGRLRKQYRRQSGELWDVLVMGLVLEA
jgi:hypothetical protein